MISEYYDEHLSCSAFFIKAIYVLNFGMTFLQNLDFQKSGDQLISDD